MARCAVERSDGLLFVTAVRARRLPARRRRKTLHFRAAATTVRSRQTIERPSHASKNPIAALVPPENHPQILLRSP